MLKGTYKHTEEAKTKIGEANRRRRVSEETRSKLSKSHRDKRLSEETKRKISLTKKGKPNLWQKGILRSEETKQKLSEISKGSKNSNWRGGITFELYTINWTQTLRRAIRERDNYTCQICGKLQGDIAFDVHHVDYNKENCNPDNLITLCNRCHGKTNQNRQYWQGFLLKIIRLDRGELDPSKPGT